MKSRKRLYGSLRAYLRWPLYLTVLLVVMNVGIYLVDHTASLIMTCFVALYFIIALMLYLIKRNQVAQDMVRFAASYGQVQSKLLKELSLPYAILDETGRILWSNDEFCDAIGVQRRTHHMITSVFAEVTPDSLPKNEQDVEIHLTYGVCDYRVVLRRVLFSDFEEDEYLAVEEEELSGFSSLCAIYLYNETEMNILKKQNSDQKLIIGLLYIDNYEEALESIDEVRRSLLTALVDRKINKYMQEIDAVIKKLEKDKYIFMFQYKYLQQLQSNKFSILEEVRSVNIGNEMSVTVSMGLGVNADTYIRGYELSRAAIDLALGRGGDQAVIKDGDKISYYGGKSASVEKNTRVKARVKAHALKEFVESKDKLLIMGHTMADVDSFGAAIGIYRIAKTLGKRAYIVMNDITSTIRPVLGRFVNNPDYEEDLVINNQTAMQLVDNGTMLVVVDVSRPSKTQCPELLNMVRTVIVLDHHRRSEDSISNAALSYIEPSASSACEMVAEILQYTGSGLKLRQAEADAMYAGIMIDTKYFQATTGVRTFEAAAYLKRSGADVTRIRKAFRTEVPEYRRKSHAIANAEFFMDAYAFAECDGRDIEDPAVLGAQTADELLEISHIKASFVFTLLNDKVYISARAIDELNVQVIMEKLGGGGHIDSAGAQIDKVTVSEAMDRVKEILTEMTSEGET